MSECLRSQAAQTPHFSAKETRYHAQYPFSYEILLNVFLIQALCIKTDINLQTWISSQFRLCKCDINHWLLRLIGDYLCGGWAKQNILQYIHTMLPVALVSKMTLGLPTILVIQLIYHIVYEYQSFLCNLGAKTYTIFNPDCLEF